MNSKVIENKSEFKLFLESNQSKTKSKNAISSIISRLQYVANEYGRVDSSLTEEKVEMLFSKLHVTKHSRTSHSSDDGIKSLKASLIKYLEYLKQHNNILDDIKSLEHNQAIEETEKQTLVQARLGQGKFREELIKLWGCCSVSGYSGLSLLIASHIKPWSKSSNAERLDKHNGLLLTPNLDKAFDSGNISFDDNGKILISKSLKEPESLGIHDSLCIPYKSKNTEKYMAYHREHIFNN